MQLKHLITISCISALACIAALTLNASWMFPYDRTDPRISGLKNPIHLDDTSIQRGKEINETYCKACHTGKGKTNKVLKKVNESSDSIIFNKIYYGNDGKKSDGSIDRSKYMPGFGQNLPADLPTAGKKHLTDEQIWDVINYYKHTSAQQKTEFKHKKDDDEL